MFLKFFCWCMLLAVLGVTNLPSQLAYPHDRTTNRDTTVVRIYADGNIRSLMNGGNEESTGGAGFLRLTYIGNDFFLAASGSFASSVDTLTSQVGATLFAPTYSKAFRSILLDGRKWFGKRKSGLHAYLGGSIVPWGVKSASAGFTDSAEATVLALGAGYFEDLFSSPMTDSLGKNYTGITVELGWALRKLTGGVTDGNHSVIQDQALGTRRTAFTGPVLVADLRLNDIVLSFAAYAMFHTHGLEGMNGIKLGAALGGQGSFQKWLLVGGQ